MSPDQINTLFELAGSVLLWLNVVRLWKDGKVQGVSLWPAVFFCAWGFWNLHYYGALSQPLSQMASCGMLAAHISWLTMALVFRVSGGGRA